MKTTLLNPNRQQGMTYMTVVITMIVVGTMLAAYLSLVSVQGNLAMRSQNWNRSIPIVEAGVEEGFAHLNNNSTPDASGVVDVSKLVADGWSVSPYYVGSTTGPWVKWGYMDGDWYYVMIDSWDGTTNYFPTIMAASYVLQNDAFTGHRDHNYSVSMNGSSGSSAFLAAINPSQFPDLGAGSQYSRRLVSCGLTNNPIFVKAIVARHGIDINGNDVFTDSYDSRIPAYSTNGRWDSTKRRDHGDIASNDTVTNTINAGNANIYGRIATGPNGTISIGPNGKVGDIAWQNDGSSHGIKPGYSTDDMNVEFPDVVMPTNITWSAMPSGGTVGGVTYDYIFNSSGYYIKTSGDISGKILVTARDVKLRVDTGWSFTGNDGMLLGSNAAVKIYLNCASANISGNGIVNSNGTPDECYIFGTTRLTSLTLGGNGEMTSVIYAPYADVTLNGGGHGDDDFSGAIMANSFRFNGHYSVHYDEALARVGTWKGFTIISWNER